uniref:Uncharacterized protein n=1 Tax=Rhizophora mucronata TaxID=61149 RepID=A0A2P2QJM7_RHIMU
MSQLDFGWESHNVSNPLRLAIANKFCRN